MMKKIILLLMCFALTAEYTFSQNALWTGAIDNDFFNESNWVLEGTENTPGAGSIDNNIAIDLNLVIEQADLVLATDVDIQFTAGKGVKLINASIDLGSISSGYVELNNKSTLILQSTTPMGADASIKLEDNHSWVKLINVEPVTADTNYLSKITSLGSSLVLNENVDIHQYYYFGCIIRLKDADTVALTLFDEKSQSGTSFGVTPVQVYSDEQLGSFNNMASSFRLERGYMAVIATFQNGIGKSENYIASEEALEMDLPAALDNTISFVRVMPWNWVTKKGASGFKEVGNSWTYNWGKGSVSLPNMEYAPMSWGSGGASNASVGDYLAMERVTHALGFNESDNCDGQSGQYGNLCQIEVAVPLYQNLMKTGLRLVSPSPRENGPFQWLKVFRDYAVDTDVRYDVLGVHWYDWGGKPSNTPFEDATKVFNRFKSYLTNVYNEHQMPIWITEFNANANRDASVHRAFLELALPYLESLDYIERYDFFEPNPDVAGNRTDIQFPRFFDEAGNITPFGIFYRDFKSTPSIPESVYAGSGLLAGLDTKVQVQLAIDSTEIAEGESLKITVTTNRPVAAPENLTLQISLDESQYTIATNLIEIGEGFSSAEVILTAFDDDLVEDLMIGSISLTNLSEGIEWAGAPVDFSITSEDVEEIVVLSLLDNEFSTSIYPNPTDRFVTIETNQNIQSAAVFSFDGRLQDGVSVNDSVLDFYNVRPGAYIIKLILEDGKTMNKLIFKN